MPNHALTLLSQDLRPDARWHEERSGFNERPSWSVLRRKGMEAL